MLVAGRFTDNVGTFVVHCHMLEHEDHGMMGQYEVVATGAPADSGTDSTASYCTILQATVPAASSRRPE